MLFFVVSMFLLFLFCDKSFPFSFDIFVDFCVWIQKYTGKGSISWLNLPVDIARMSFVSRSDEMCASV